MPWTKTVASERAQMCGIFGFALKKPMSIARVFRVLERLEVSQYPQEPTPVGGYGAGLAILEEDGSVVLQKVAKVKGSPAESLAEVVKAREASVLVGHVRRPSPEFMNTAKFKVTAQPYIVELDPKLTIVSVHNGRVLNYREIRAKLGQAHVFESENVELIDSEVIPHYFEELLKEMNDVDDALYALSCALQGPSAVGMLQIGEENTFLHLIHKGKTRGLTVWTNERNEVIFCSRREPLMEGFKKILAEGEFEEKIWIRHGEDVGLKLSFSVLR
jgi:glucosamine 6-phosphate synthetase-like amidotransferase/phosphosugar isomerase protein